MLDAIIENFKAEIKAVVAETISSELARYKKGKENAHEQVLTCEEAARALRIGRSTLYRFSAQGLVKHYKRGKRLYFLQKDLAAFVEAGAKASYEELAEEARATLITRNSLKKA